MVETKQLSTLAVATITTGIVLVHGFAGVGEAFEHIMGHPVWTHEMPGYGDRARDLVLAQYPDFPTNLPNRDQWQAFSAELVERYGETIEIVQGEGLRDMDPLSSLADMVGDRPVIVVEPQS